MRTKTLLLTAALAAAGAATSMAQTVYSVNIVGYINLDVPAGFSLVANQLNASGGNKVSSLLASPPNNTQVYKFIAAQGAYVSISFVDGAWEGDDVDMTLNPGEGVFVNAPSAFKLTLVGEVPLSSSVAVAKGFSIVSSALPQSGPLDGAPPAGLGFPIGNNDGIYQYVPAARSYKVNSFVDGAWEGDDGGNAPAPGVGEAFFVFRAGDAGTWNRTFSVGP